MSRRPHAQAATVADAVAADNVILCTLPRISMTLDKAREGLRGIRLLASLSDEQIDPLAAKMTWMKADRRAPVVTYCDETRTVFFIIAGACEVMLRTAPKPMRQQRQRRSRAASAARTAPAPRDITFRRLDAGSHFGEIAALTGAPRTATVVAEKGCVLAECPCEVFLELMKNGAVASAAAAAASRTTALLTECVVERTNLSAPTRLCAEFVRMTRPGTDTDTDVRIERLPTQVVMAALTGSQRSPVSHALKRLKKEGLIERDGRAVVIPDIRALKKRVRDEAGLPLLDFHAWPI